MDTVYVATSNRHKVVEINAVLEGCGYRAESVAAPKVEIQSESLDSIAVVAASLAYSVLGKPVLVEDAGLFIDALRGFPGPYSSYVYKTIGVEGVIRLMKGFTDRRAIFRSVMAYAGPWGVVVFRGEAEGVIVDQPRGEGGFGFDPIFKPIGSSKTFAEMSLEEKNAYSHRARAARRLCSWLQSHETI